MTVKQMFFISGLPRSGSTLLSSILRQNPAVHAGMSSPLLNTVSSVERSLSQAQQFAIDVDDDTRKRVLRSLFDSFYAEHAAPIIFDTNRVWTNKLGLLLDLFPDTKIVCCVRSLNAIIESFERVVRENRLQPSAIFHFDAEINVYGRVERYMVANGVVGAALNPLKEAFYGSNSNRLLLLSYDRLVADPAGALGAVYDFTGTDRFAHDFDRLEFSAHEFDSAFGMAGLHDVRTTISQIRRQPTLPPDLAQMFAAPEFWISAPLNSKAKRLI